MGKKKTTMRKKDKQESVSVCTLKSLILEGVLVVLNLLHEDFDKYTVFFFINS